MNRLLNIQKHLKVGAYGRLHADGEMFQIERQNKDSYLVFSSQRLNEASEEDLDGFVTRYESNAIDSAHYVSPFAVIKGREYRIIGWNHKNSELMVGSEDSIPIEGLSYVEEDRNFFVTRLSYHCVHFEEIRLRYDRAWNLNEDTFVNRTDIIYLNDQAPEMLKKTSSSLSSLDLKQDRTGILKRKSLIRLDEVVSVLADREAAATLASERDLQEGDLVAVSLGTIVSMIEKLKEVGAGSFVEQIALKETQIASQNVNSGK